jgi:hypothetical protein
MVAAGGGVEAGFLKKTSQKVPVCRLAADGADEQAAVVTGFQNL